MKKIMLLIIITTLALNCGGGIDKTTIIGKWESAEVIGEEKEKGPSAPKTPMTLEFNEDGTAVFDAFIDNGILKVIDDYNWKEDAFGDNGFFEDGMKCKMCFENTVLGLMEDGREEIHPIVFLSNDKMLLPNDNNEAYLVFNRVQ